MTTSREDIWEWPDRFSARIPPGWQMRSQEPIEIVPSEGGGAAHITFLRRERSSSPNEVRQSASFERSNVVEAEATHWRSGREMYSSPGTRFWRKLQRASLFGKS